MSNIKVFTAEEFNIAVNADVSRVLTVEKKKDDKSYKGSKFLNGYFFIGNNARKEGWFSVKDIVITMGVADPMNTEDRRNDYPGTRLLLQTTRDNAGAFGQALCGLQPQWVQIVTDLVAAGTINITGRRIHDLVQVTYSDEHNDKAKAGQLLADPVIRIKVDFDNFPATYPHAFLRNEPKTKFFDYRTKYIETKDGKSREQYKLAMVKNDQGVDEPVSAKNLHKFITKGSILRSGRIMMSSVAVSSSWISMPMTINHAVIETGLGEGFSDEFEGEESVQSFIETMSQAHVNSSVLETPPVDNTPTIVLEANQQVANQQVTIPVVTQQANADPVKNLLDSM